MLGCSAQIVVVVLTITHASAQLKYPAISPIVHADRTVALALSMISEESFQAGIHRLAEHVGGNPDDEWLLFDKMTLTVGHKRETKV